MNRTLAGRATAIFAVAATLATIGVSATTATAAPAGKPATGHSTADRAFIAGEKAAARDNSTPASRAAVAQVQKQVRSYTASHAGAYTFGTYADPKTGAVVVETNAPATVTKSLTRITGVGTGTQVSVRKAAAISDQFNRRDDSSPFWGGNGLLANGALCSAGYAVKSSSGYPYMVTAGHCYANGIAVRTESNRTFEGYVTGRLLASQGGGPRDMELLYSQSYAGRIYTGGTTSTSSAPVVSAGNAVQGYTAYCHSGRTSGEQCGHRAISVNAQVCTATGCKFPVIAWQGGGASQGGDSGSPFYAKDSAGKVYIRGHVIAGNGTTSYSEKWDKVASAYGVSIVTG